MRKFAQRNIHSFQSTEEMDKEIETAVANMHYRTKTHLILTGIEKVLAEVRLKEQKYEQVVEQTEKRSGE